MKAILAIFVAFGILIGTAPAVAQGINPALKPGFKVPQLSHAPASLGMCNLPKGMAPPAPGAFVEFKIDGQDWSCATPTSAAPNDAGNACRCAPVTKTELFTLLAMPPATCTSCACNSAFCGTTSSGSDTCTTDSKTGATTCPRLSHRPFH